MQLYGIVWNFLDIVPATMKIFARLVLAPRVDRTNRIKKTDRSLRVKQQRTGWKTRRQKFLLKFKIATGLILAFPLDRNILGGTLIVWIRAKYLTRSNIVCCPIRRPSCYYRDCRIFYRVRRIDQ
jgi:hypothetical protein